VFNQLGLVHEKSPLEGATKPVPQTCCTDSAGALTGPTASLTAGN